MYKAWWASAEGGEELAQKLEAQLNEFAGEVIAVSYAVDTGTHHVLAVYREVESSEGSSAEEAVAVAERIIDRMHPQEPDIYSSFRDSGVSELSTRALEGRNPDADGGPGPEHG
jgi:hypothetical protein